MVWTEQHKRRKINLHSQCNYVQRVLIACSLMSLPDSIHVCIRTFTPTPMHCLKPNNGAHGPSWQGKAAPGSGVEGEEESSGGPQLALIPGSESGNREKSLTQPRTGRLVHIPPETDSLWNVLRPHCYWLSTALKKTCILNGDWFHLIFWSGQISEQRLE